MQTLILATMALGFAACGGDGSAALGGDGSAALPQRPDTLVISGDAELRDMANAMLPGLARRSGLELREPVRVERRSREELQAYLRAKLDEELPVERARRLTEAYALLGLMPRDVDLRALLLSVYQEQVAGFYDPDSTALFVMADQSAAALEPILLHELVHAVQDQWTDLDAVTDPGRGNDRSTAAQAAIEGHATLVMLEYMTEQMQGREVDLTEVPGFGMQMRSVLATARDQYPELARAPRVVQEGMLFPYIEGAGFVLEVWRERGGREGGLAPLLPESTEQVLDPARFLGDPPDHPSHPRLVVTQGEVLLEDGLGAAELRILLEELAGADAAAAAGGWDGDRYALVADGAGRTSLVWATVWDDPGSRDRFVAALLPVLASLPEPAVLESRSVDGRPVAVLTVADGPGVTVTLEGAG